MIGWISMFVGPLLVSLALTGRLVASARRMGMLDVPNERSSHSHPTPTGGGLAIIAAVIPAVPVAWLAGAIDGHLAMALVGGVGIAAVGFIDDRRTVSPGARLIVHVLAAAWALAWVGGVPPVQLGTTVFNLGWVGHGVGIVAIVWVLNLFNFMDGIDGLAGSEGAFVTGAGAMLVLAVGQSTDSAPVALMLSAACIGFLRWNWPPARIFMGDVGSGFIGYVIAILALASAHTDAGALFAWLILGAVFVVDATVTLVRRLTRGERVYQAHRSHAYQRLSRRWKSHRRFTLSALAVNILWLLPLATAALIYPESAAWLTVVAMVPIIAVACSAGAGLPD